MMIFGHEHALRLETLNARIRREFIAVTMRQLIWSWNEFTRTPAPAPASRISPLQQGGDAAPPRRGGGAAEQDRLQASHVLRCEPIRLGRALADRLAGDRRGGRRTDPGRAGRIVRAV